MDHLLGELVLQLAVDEARELGVQALVARDQLVGEGEARHQAALLEPVDGAERATEQNSLHGRKRDDALGEASLLWAHPLHCPLGLLPDGRHGVDRVEDLLLLGGVPDVLLDQQRVRLRVNVLHGHLETIECTSLRQLHLVGELRRQVLQHDAVGGREEGQDVLDEMPLLRRQGVPVFVVLREVDLLRSPERGLVLLVHLPDVRVLDREHHPPTRVLLEDGLVLLQLAEPSRHVGEVRRFGGRQL
mmetsp:Transcript_125581/g.340970  ORF Transcript_125581/g.340970 Transcript_125581/m.340970 type:complete len:245 (+) Transcript_125581:738-1472(+)